MRQRLLPLCMRGERGLALTLLAAGAVVCAVLLIRRMRRPGADSRCALRALTTTTTMTTMTTKTTMMTT